MFYKSTVVRSDNLAISAAVVSVPAILKGCLDKVFAMGKFYENGRIYNNGLLKGKKALLSITTGGPEKNYITAKYGSTD